MMLILRGNPLEMDVRIPLPSIPPIWREGLVGLEAAALMRSPVWHGAGQAPGDGRPVVLIPGFLAGDGSLALMTRWLRGLGYHTHRAGIRSHVDCSAAVCSALESVLERMADKTGERVSIVGQSRGGSFAKVLAARRPDLVSGIVALGSPQVGPLAVHPLVRLQVTAVGALGTLGAPRLFSRSCMAGDCCTDFWDALRSPLPDGLGYVSIFSRSDGIVDWHACLDEGADHVEISSSHIGMAVHPDAYRVVSAALEDFRRRDARSKKSEAPASAPRRLRRAA